MTEELIPTDRDSSRKVSLDVVGTLLKTTSNPRFAGECQAFVDAFQPGDEVVEFCSAKIAWRQGTGWSGYRLVRSGEVISQLLTRIS